MVKQEDGRKISSDQQAPRREPQAVSFLQRKEDSAGGGGSVAIPEAAYEEVAAGTLSWSEVGGGGFMADKFLKEAAANRHDDAAAEVAEVEKPEDNKEKKKGTGFLAARQPEEALKRSQPCVAKEDAEAASKQPKATAHTEVVTDPGLKVALVALPKAANLRGSRDERRKAKKAEGKETGSAADILPPVAIMAIGVIIALGLVAWTAVKGFQSAKDMAAAVGGEAVRGGYAEAARAQAEEEARFKAAEQARLQAEEDARLKAEEALEASLNEKKEEAKEETVAVAAETQQQAVEEILPVAERQQEAQDEARETTRVASKEVAAAGATDDKVQVSRFTVGTFVWAKVTFKTDSDEDPVTIRQGTWGRIEEVNEDGSLEVGFQGVEDTEFVDLENILTNLQLEKPRPEPVEEAPQEVDEGVGMLEDLLQGIGENITLAEYHDTCDGPGTLARVLADWGQKVEEAMQRGQEELKHAYLMARIGTGLHVWALVLSRTLASGGGEEKRTWTTVYDSANMPDALDVIHLHERFESAAQRGAPRLLDTSQFRTRFMLPLYRHPQGEKGHPLEAKLQFGVQATQNSCGIHAYLAARVLLAVPTPTESANDSMQLTWLPRARCVAPGVDKSEPGMPFLATPWHPSLDCVSEYRLQTVQLTTGRASGTAATPQLWAKMALNLALIPAPEDKAWQEHSYVHLLRALGSSC
eukprot:TRINITY_DN19776_c0_g1_i4.p1 TRINITY_DN19776_c0_g1~~TRINITY_DN19776_c0_g1_i4.p1  ORF type:complete len:699 (-),score=252.20 TRINITY_DN19776_c0_g1_i4:384-2480(-)